MIVSLQLMSSHMGQLKDYHVNGLVPVLVHLEGERCFLYLWYKGVSVEIHVPLDFLFVCLVEAEIVMEGKKMAPT